MTTPITPSTSSGSTAAGSSSTSSSTQGPDGLLNPQTFLQLLVDQLKYQNPLNPTDSSQFVSQVAQLSQVEALQNVSQQEQAASTAEQAMASASLIGRQVQGTGANGTLVSGVVTGVTVASGTPQLEVGGSTLALGQVTSISGATTG